MKKELTVWRNPNPVARYVSDLKKYNELLNLHSQKRQELDNITQQVNVYARRIDNHIHLLKSRTK